MLEARNVTGSYGPITAVRNLDFSIQPGSAVALVGRNGAGKSTVLKLLAGVMRPTKGEILWDGECINDETPDRRVRRGIALVPEGRHVFPALTVEDNPLDDVTSRPGLWPIASSWPNTGSGVVPSPWREPDGTWSSPLTSTPPQRPLGPTQAWHGRPGGCLDRRAGARIGFES